MTASEHLAVIPDVAGLTFGRGYPAQSWSSLAGGVLGAVLGCGRFAQPLASALVWGRHPAAS
jgi:hypothetical protein